MMQMGFNRQLGDVTDVIQQIPGVTDAETLLQDKVKATVQPYVLVSLFMGLAGFVFGFAAFIGMRSMKTARGG